MTRRDGAPWLDRNRVAGARSTFRTPSNFSVSHPVRNPPTAPFPDAHCHASVWNKHHWIPAQVGVVEGGACPSANSKGALPHASSMASLRRAVITG